MAILPQVQLLNWNDIESRSDLRLVDKTISSVEFGFREDIPGIHVSDLLIFHFTDGTILSIDTGSNASALSGAESGFSPENLHIDLNLHIVPALARLAKEPE